MSLLLYGLNVPDAAGVRQVLFVAEDSRSVPGRPWRPAIERDLQRLRVSVRGQPHSRNLDQLESLVEHGDILGLHRVLTGLDRDSIEMRQVSPIGGAPQSERQVVLQKAS